MAHFGAQGRNERSGEAASSLPGLRLEQTKKSALGGRSNGNKAATKR